MKSYFKYYIISWGVLVVLFNVLVFVALSKFANKNDVTFWMGYIFIMLTFIVQFGVAWYSLKDDIGKIFYRIPLLLVSHASLIAMFFGGLLCMLIHGIPVWFAIILCTAMLAFSVVSVMQAQTAGEIADKIENKIKNKTFFIRSLTVDIDSLLSKSASSEMSGELKKIYDAARYSDSVSNDALADVEADITIKVGKLSECVEKNDLEGVKGLVTEIVILINDRNKQCKLLK